ncbi:MAG TPA: sodium ABC transporter permease [Rheinheimera sp.]|uniref:ABC transporter permease n=1 Tax=Rheinheimera sp. TaxID=1869214 RepID=UPI000EDE8A18|nr:ABC transporter permease [Rheinheimera sp.]HCU64772.1 sodium ABC transporter permease [Rheinheimera sp.]
MWQVYQKELLELMRDKKTLMFVVLLPLLIFPLLFGLMGLVMSNVSRQAEAEEHRYVIINAERAPAFADALFYHKNFKKVETELTAAEDLKQAIRDDKFDVAIVIPADFDVSAENLNQSKWQLIHNSSSQLDMISKHFNDLLKTFSKKLQQDKLAGLGVSSDKVAAVLEPVTVERINTAESRENIGEKIGGFIAYLLVPLVLAGASYPAMDIGAGEKERGTLETLLICPISRSAIVLGKFLTVLTTGLVSAALTVISFGGWGYLIGSMAGVDVVAKTMETLGFIDLTLILALLLPLSAIFAALLLSLSIYARSYKEAQNYIGPVTMVVFMPLVVAILPGVELNWKTAMVPVLNVALSIKELVKGTIDYLLLAAVLGSTLLIAAAAIAFCVSWFQKEKVLFR